MDPIGGFLFKVAGTPKDLAITTVLLIVVAAVTIWGICGIYNNKK